ncbi:MAG: histidine kinase N-terminal domain-containing protein [Mycobacteriaceae bacterium]
MSTLTRLLAEHTRLSGVEVDHLQRVVGEWQLLADLSFADYLLWTPVTTDAEPQLVCVAQVRPTTANTTHPEDAVGTVAGALEGGQLHLAMSSAAVIGPRDVSGADGTQQPLRRRRGAVPVRAPGGRVVAVLSRDTSLSEARGAGALENAYLQCASELCQMIADGTFPTDEAVSDVHTSPRAGDGFIRLEPGGTVLYASPNALSAYHRMGLPTEILGTDLAHVTRRLITDPFDAAEVVGRIRAALAGQASFRVEADARGATVLLRALPLHPRGVPAGALVLVRDVTEVRRRDRALLSKDATIREIHHRVKNNLQTVAALLRLQARRTTNAEARSALAESVRRVSSIALVHETLSMSVDERVDLDDVVDRLLPMMVDVATLNSAVVVRREGHLGVMAAELATPLVMVLTELVQNALEHAFEPGVGGSVVIQTVRTAAHLDVVVRDDGRGLPEDFAAEAVSSLGLQIVRTLVDAELQGTLELRAAAGGGTDAVLRVPLLRRER